jgi:hypothetical protein
MLGLMPMMSALRAARPSTFLPPPPISTLGGVEGSGSTALAMFWIA